MSHIFHPSKKAIELALEKMKSDGLVHPEASFNYDAPDGLRMEVTYRDHQFAHRLGKTVLEEEIVDSALEFLKSLKLVDDEANYDKKSFEIFRKEVKEKFKGSWTSLSPTMERLFYMLTSVKKPKRMIELGSFWGYTLAFFAGPCVGGSRAYEADKIYGIDIDSKMTEQARVNFEVIPNCEALELIAEDAQVALEKIEGTFDFVYIEAKADDADGLYLKLLKQIYDKLPKGGWVMAHDNFDWSFKKEMDIYLPWVHNKDHFSESIAFDIDDCGIELSVK